MKGNRVGRGFRKRQACFGLIMIIIIYVLSYTYTDSVKSPKELLKGAESSEGVRQVVNGLGLSEFAPKLPEIEATKIHLEKSYDCVAQLRLGHVERGNNDGGWNICLDTRPGATTTSETVWPVRARFSTHREETPNLTLTPTCKLQPQTLTLTLTLIRTLTILQFAGLAWSTVLVVRETSRSRDLQRKWAARLYFL